MTPKNDKIFLISRTVCVVLFLCIIGCGKRHKSEFENLKSRAENGEIDAQISLGRCYENGTGVNKDINEAIKWYRKPKEWTTKCFSNGFTESDHDFIKLKNYAEGGDHNFEYLVALCYDNNHDMRVFRVDNKPKESKTEAINWYQKAISGGWGDVRAMCELADKTSDKEEAKRLLNNACGLGYSHAKFILSRYYLYEDINDISLKVNRDVMKVCDGIRLLEDAAEQGHNIALMELYFIYYNGHGRLVAPDERKAWRYERRAIEQELSISDLFYEQEFHNSIKNINPNFLNYMSFAADCRAEALIGNVNSQYLLANYYTYGRGVEKDPVEAIKWYRKASEQGHALALFSLGNRYYDGDGVIRDEVEAYACWNLAGCSISKARECIFKLEQKITPEIRLAGQKRSKELKDKIEARKAGSEKKWWEFWR